MKKTGEETITHLKNLKITQRNDFQNFTLDSVLLADFTRINRRIKKILDIGTGFGIIPLLLSEKSKSDIKGIEIYGEMAEIAKRNVKDNNLSDRIEIINEDIKNYNKIFMKDEFDLIVTNPPYFEFDGNIKQISSLSHLANARHNINITMEEIICISSYLLKNSGYFSLVFRSERLVEILLLLRKYNLEPKRLKSCYTKKEGDAKICLVEAIKDAEKGFRMEYPVYIYEKNGKKTEYIKKLYE